MRASPSAGTVVPPRTGGRTRTGGVTIGDVAVWTSFVDLVHFVGAAGSAALVVGFAADGEGARAAFYAVVALAFAVALLRRRAQRRTPAAPAVVDLRTASAAPALAESSSPPGTGPDEQRSAA